MNERRFELIYAPQVREHLQPIDRQHRSLIRRTIEEQLLLAPAGETSQRQPLGVAVLGAEWELRFGPQNRFRVFYEVDEGRRSVAILALGVSDGSRLLIDGREVGG